MLVLVLVVCGRWQRWCRRCWRTSHAPITPNQLLARSVVRVLSILLEGLASLWVLQAVAQVDGFLPDPFVGRRRVEGCRGICHRPPPVGAPSWRWRGRRPRGDCAGSAARRHLPNTSDRQVPRQRRGRIRTLHRAHHCPTRRASSQQPEPHNPIQPRASANGRKCRVLGVEPRVAAGRGDGQHDPLRGTTTKSTSIHERHGHKQPGHKQRGTDHEQPGQSDDQRREPATCSQSCC
jgi:hypothetical protein